jgi:hypothetical protein
MTVVAVDYAANFLWSTGSEAPESGTDPMIPVTNLSTVSRKFTTDQITNILSGDRFSQRYEPSAYQNLLDTDSFVDTVQIFPEVEFTYTLWMYQVDPTTIPLGGDFNVGQHIFYLMLDPLIKGKNITVTNSIYVDERVIPPFPSATDPLVYFNGTSGIEPYNSFAFKDDWTVDDFILDTSYTSSQGDNRIYPFWMFRNDPRKDGTFEQIIDADRLPRGRSSRTFQNLGDYVSYFNGYDRTGDADFVSKNTQYNSIIDNALNVTGDVIFSAKATISGYYTHDELFSDVTAKYVPVGESDLSTPNISLGGNQVNYSGVLSGIPQGQEVYEIKPDATQQVLLPIRIQARQHWPEFQRAFELGGSDYRYSVGLTGATPYRTDKLFTSLQDYEKNGIGTVTGFTSGQVGYLTNTQDYSKTGTFISDYFNSSDYKDGIRTSSLQQTTTETEESEDAGGY